MSRLGKMPSWQRSFVIGGMLTCSITGSLYLLGHEFQFQRSTLGAHNILALHGIAAMLATIALGTVLPFHLKSGIKSGRKMISGFGQLSFLLTLLITGVLLYYGPEEIREEVISTHWIVGLVFFAVFLLHGVVRLKGLSTLSLFKSTGARDQQASAQKYRPPGQGLDNPAG
ncbi:hypothetical protein [Polynucleobacter sp.]|jgi:hypothetical protein|uniref:hypothetical protein n=1 Tax=Polynucleobacter sp. TaxID=2029855 RepID=UPI00301B4790